MAGKARGALIPTVLTPGERLLLRRMRAGVTQRTMARAQGLSVNHYRHREKDRDMYFRPVPIPPDHLVTVGLTIGEWCLFQRRRRGWSVDELATRLKISRVTVIKSEHDQTSGSSRVRDFYLETGELIAKPTTPSTTVSEAGAA